MTGHQNDGLTASGQQQCRWLAHALQHRAWQPSHIYTSPLRRAVESVAYLLAPWGWSLPAVNEYEEMAIAVEDVEDRWLQGSSTDPRSPCPPVCISTHLAEFQAGILTGLTWAAARQQYPTLCHQLETTSDWIPIPGAETPFQGQQRARQFIQMLLATHGQADTVWVMTHHWILEQLVAAFMGCDRTWQLTIPNTALFEFWIDRDRWSDAEMSPWISNFWQIKRFGDTTHLCDSITNPSAIGEQQ